MPPVNKDKSTGGKPIPRTPAGAVKTNVVSKTGKPQPGGSKPMTPASGATSRPTGKTSATPAQPATSAAPKMSARDKAAAELAELKARTAQAQAEAQAKVLAEYTVVSGDTLSGIADRFYHSVKREMWMAIYEANKDVIGPNPGMIKVGQKLKIPKL